METQNIQATINLTLTREQLLMLLRPDLGSPQQVAAPQQMPQMMAAPQAPAPVPQMFPAAQPAQPVQSPMPVQTPPTIPQMQATPTPIPQNPPMPVQTAPQTYTVEQLGLAARPLVENGRREELVALLGEFGAPSVAAIPENRRSDFAARLRALGGQI